MIMTMFFSRASVPRKSEVTCTSSFQKYISNIIALTMNIFKAVHQTVLSNMLLNYINKYLIISLSIATGSKYLFDANKF